MKADLPLISKGTLQEKQLAGKVALVTGAGDGIGFETARSLIWLGAKVIIAEINKEKGKEAAQKLNREFCENSALFVYTDIGSEREVRKLCKKVYRQFGHLDILINNATIAPIGAVYQVGIKNWDNSYKTNVRRPVLLVEQFLPQMIERNSGVIVFVPSSGAAPYMGAYEVFKTAQVELANTLSAELEGTEIYTYSIGPGLVRTETAQRAILKIAPLHQLSRDEFYKMNEQMILSPEEAGAGFAASVANARFYHGLETSSIQALKDAGITAGEQQAKQFGDKVTEEERNKLLTLLTEIKHTFFEQVEGWKNRSIFERQWILRDFKKNTGTPPELFMARLEEYESLLETIRLEKWKLKKLEIHKLRNYYQHQIGLLKGYAKDADRVNEFTGIIQNWIKAIEQFEDMID